MAQVNLDVLIPREDLEIKEQNKSIDPISHISISSLREGEFFRESLRKPDFQRETCEWTPQKVHDLVDAFVTESLIPAIILWKGEGNVFVIDGAHRLSAIIAWVSNDYGDGSRSRAFVGDSIDPKQLELADKTRKLIEKNIGSYQDILWASQNPDKAEPKKLQIARKLATINLKLQWVPGDASQAEKSFYKINESASEINNTEKRILYARKKPSAIAARAIIRGGGGHKYWSKFKEQYQDKLEELSKEISEWLFEPYLKTPLKTLDVPLAGKRYEQSTLELVLNIVNHSNGLKIVDGSKIKKKEDYPEQSIPDEGGDGAETIGWLASTKKMLANITGTQSSSLGLHPAIYFYSRNGRYQITAFMAFVYLITDYEKRKQLKKFTKIRKDFEEFLWSHKEIVNQAQPRWGSGAKGYVQLSRLFDFIINLLVEEKTSEQIIQALDDSDEFNFYKSGINEINPKHRKKFSSESKSEVFLREAIQKAIRCNICGGFIHTNSIQIDHVMGVAKGGIGNATNGALTHPYCNSIKDNLLEDGWLQEQKAFVTQTNG